MLSFIELLAAPGVPALEFDPGVPALDPGVPALEFEAAALFLFSYPFFWMLKMVVFH